ncbi:MAG: N4-gp56 family major capsid protein [Clostridia bacterium]|nr:N4-gp56 family major capsid protein [Clostridia bacterium]
MNDTEFDLQLFAAGDTVAGTSAYINANTGAASSYSGGGLSAEMKTFYDKTLITLAGANLVHEQFGQKRPIPAGSGKTIEFRRFSSLPKALTPITEGVTPAGNKLSVSTVTATVDQYGDYIEQTDLLELTSVDNTIVETTKKLAEQAGKTIDTVVREVINAGTNVLYCPAVSGSTVPDVTSRADVTSACKLRVRDVFRAAAELKAMNAPKIDGCYAAIIHPYVAYDLMQEAGDEWIDITKYTTPDNILTGEIGKLAGIRFVESSEAKIFAPAVISDGLSRLTVKTANSSASTSVAVDETLTAATGLSIPVYIGGTANTITAITAAASGSVLTVSTATTCAVGDVVCGKGAGCDGSAVFSTLVLGADAFGVTDVANGGIEHIVKQKGYGSDPLNQRSSIGWKALGCAEILVDEYIVRIESGSSYSSMAEAN